MEKIKRIIRNSEQAKDEKESIEKQEEHKLGCKISQLIWKAPGHLQETLVSRIVDREVLRIKDPLQKKIDNLEQCLEKIEGLILGLVDILAEIDKKLNQCNHSIPDPSPKNPCQIDSLPPPVEKDPFQHSQVVKEAELKVPSFESWLKDSHLNHNPSCYSPQYHPETPEDEPPPLDLIQQKEQLPLTDLTCYSENYKLSHEELKEDFELPKDNEKKDPMISDHIRKTLRKLEPGAVEEVETPQKRKKIWLEEKEETFIISLFK